MATQQQDFRVKNGLIVGGAANITGRTTIEDKMLIGNELGNANLSNVVNFAATQGAAAYRSINLIDTSAGIKLARITNDSGLGPALELQTWSTDMSTNTAYWDFYTAPASGFGIRDRNPLLTRNRIFIGTGGNVLIGSASGTPATSAAEITTNGTTNILQVQGNSYFAGDANITGAITSVDSIQFDTALTYVDPVKGQVRWNEEEGSLDVGLGNGLVANLPEETLYEVTNNTASTITKGTLVASVGTTGNSGKILAAPYNSAVHLPVQIMGLAAENIISGANGHVTHFGKVRGIQTNGGNYSETWVNNDILYARQGGGLTKTKPAAPNTKTIVALVISAHPTNGTLFVRPTLSSNLGDDDLVQLGTLANGQVIAWNSSSGRFENRLETVRTLSDLGITATSTELNYTSGVTSAIQTQLNNKVAKAGDTMTGFLTLHSDPTSGLHAATKQYVDELAEGLKTKPAVEVATTGNLTATYNNGTAGVGATLTATSNTAFPEIDGITLTSTTPGQNGVLVKNQTNAAHNGRYNLTQVGGASTPWILTRCGLCDQASEIPGAYVFVKQGTLYKGTGWVQTVTDPTTFAVGTDAILVTQFSSGALYSAGDGLILTGTQFSHADTSTQSSVTNTGNNYIQSLTLDTFGHITAITSGAPNNTTYSVKASSQTGGASLDLDAGGSGSGTDSVTFKGAGATTVTRTDADTITITSVNTTYSPATSTIAGLIELFSDTVQTVASNAVTATASRTYGIQVNSAGQAVVNVPWVDTNTTYTKATSTSLGLIELGSDTVQTVAANTVTATASRSYALQLNSSDQAVVNVPWVDTTYTAGDGLTLTGTQFSVDSTVVRTSGTTQTISGTLNVTAINENGFPVVSQADIGTAPNEIPLNQYLGNLAYQDAGSIAGPVVIGTSASIDQLTVQGKVKFTPGTGNGGENYALSLVYDNPGGGVQFVRNQSSTGWSIIRFQNDNDVRLGSIGGGNSAASVLSNTMYIASQNGFPLVLASGAGIVPSERMRIDSTGRFGFNSTSLGGGSGHYRFAGNITGAVSSTGLLYSPTIQSDVTSTGTVFSSLPSTQDSAFTLTELIHFFANQGTITGGSRTAPTNQFGFRVSSSLTGATNNYGFRSEIQAGTGRWNFHATGGAENFFGGNTVISVADNTNAALRITQTGTGNALVVEDSANPDATPFVINASGQVIVGHTATISNIFDPQTTLPRSTAIQCIGTTSPDCGITSISYSTVDGNAPFYGASFYLARSKSGTRGTPGIVASNDVIGSITFNGDDGTNFVSAAQIRAYVDGTPGTNNMPGRLAFYTTPDSGNLSVERMRIDSAGNVGIGAALPTFRLVAANSSTDGTWLYSTGAVSVLGLGGYSSALDGAFQIRYDRSTGNITFNGGSRDTLAERLRISAAGNVGIGTSSPGSILAVSAASPTITLTATTTTGTTIGNKNNRLLLLANSTTAGNGGEVVFGIADTTTGRWGAISSSIVANSAGGATGAITFATKALTTDTALTERMRIDREGNVGIGNTNPQARLQVEEVGIDTTATTLAIGAGLTAVYSVSTTLFRTMELMIQVTQGSNYHAVKLFVLHNGTDVWFNQTNVLHTTAAELGTFSMDISSGNVRALYTPTSTAVASTVKVAAIKIAV